jgi:hypothetical protein
VLDALLLVSTAAFILAGSVVGARLLLLAARTRELPDFLVGFSLFELSAIAYPLVLYGAFSDLSLADAKRVSALSHSSLGIGLACAFLFTQRVFRPGASWAIAFAGGGIALLGYGLVAGIAFVLRAPDRAGMSSPDSPVIWLQLAAVLAYTWSATEGFRCWAQARRRMRLGLADPVVVNRFLLWGFVGAASILSVAPALVLRLAGDGAFTSPISRLCTALGGLTAAIALQLAFLPPARYRAWIAGRAAT